MSLFQRIKTPFRDVADDNSVPQWDVAQAVGAVLRERREELGYDLDAIGEALRIKPVYLAALEQGRAQDLPGPAYAIGFVRAYAQLLDLDADQILDSYKAECTDVQTRPDLSLPVPLDARSLPGGPILLVGVILAACGYGTWYYLATGDRSRPERVAAVPAELQRIVQDTVPEMPAGAPSAAENPVPAMVPGGAAALSANAPRFVSGLQLPQAAAPPPAAIAAASPGPIVASPAVATSPTPAPAGDAAGEKPAAKPETLKTAVASAPAGDAGAKPAGQIDIRALADCWIQVRSGEDQSIVFSRVLKTGETYHVPRAGLVLRTGNAGALALVVDGKPAPAIGAIGTLRRDVNLDPQALLAGTAVRG